MKAFPCGAALVLLAANSLMARAADAFADCAAKTGPSFQQARRQFLSAPVDESRLKQKLASESWQERLTARILLGWLHNGEDYQALLSAPKRQDRTGTRYYAWAIDPKGIQAADVPLMYELLVKDGDPGAASDAARALIGLARREPGTPLDVAALYQFLRDESSQDAGLRSIVAWLLSSLPAKYQDEGELQSSLKKELAGPRPSRDVALSLLEGLGRASANMSDKEKDEAVRSALAAPRLEQVVGKVALTYAVGGIGGDKASMEVASYLEKSPDRLEKLWALRTLSHSDSLVATRVLLKYSVEVARGEDQTLRTEAIAGLGKTRYTPEVAARLKAIAMDTNLPGSQQLQAVSSLAQISAAHPSDKDLQREIEATLQTISAAKPNDKRLQDELKAYLETVRENRP